MHKAVLFDMDGLIFDTEVLYKQSWQQASRELGYPISEALYQRFIGVQNPECEQILLTEFGSGFPVESFREQRELLFEEIRADQGIALKAGFNQLMQSLAETQLRCALVTSSSRAEVVENFANMSEFSQFEHLVTSESVSRGKPQPECYLLACEKMSLAPRECVVLEDSNNGMRAALRAGCPALMVPDILPPEDDVRQEALGILDSLHQVMAHVTPGL